MGEGGDFIGVMFSSCGRETCCTNIVGMDTLCGTSVGVGRVT